MKGRERCPQYTIMCFTKHCSSKSPYQHIGILEGHEEWVNSLLLMEKGDLLVSGGMQVILVLKWTLIVLQVGSDGVQLWYMRNQSQLITSLYSLAQKGALTYVQWIICSCDTEEILCYGTALGYIGVWVHQPVSESMLLYAYEFHHQSRVDSKN